MPHTTTILPPALRVDDTWETLPALHAHDMDDFGVSDPSEWFDSERPTDAEDLTTIPVAANA